MISFKEITILVTVKYDVICNYATKPLEKYD